jgi:hypothetical protein
MLTFSRIICLVFAITICTVKSPAQTICDTCIELGLMNVELRQIYALYDTAVANARATGYQFGDHPDYVDHGPIMAKVGNCADWAMVSWGALVGRTWHCWRIVKIRARKQFWFWHHNFVCLEPRCGGGPRIYLDPWSSGRPDVFIGKAFPFGTGFFGWIHYRLEFHQPGDTGRQP